LKQTIILYNPKAVFFDLPLALLAIASNLDETKYKVVIIDGRIHEDPLQLIEKHLDNAICFGVTVLTGKPIKDALFITEKVKQLKPEITTVWGGWHSSLFPKETLQDTTFIDLTVQGQGEITFNEIVNAITNNNSFENIKGICYRNHQNDIIKNPPRATSKMDDLKPTNYSLIDVENYFIKKKQRQFDYISSTGCFFRCSFCADPFVYNRKWTSISAKRMGEELEKLYFKYQFTDLNFQDETFFTYKKRVLEIANEFINRKLHFSWAATMRADQGVRLSIEDFKLLKKSGLRRLLIGVESGSQDMMDWMKKDIKLEQVFECASRCQNLGISVIFPFIVGFPNESKKSIEETVKVAKNLNGMSSHFSTPIFYFKPYPGTQITFDIVEDEGYQLPKTTEQWSNFDYIGSSGPWVSNKKYAFFERFKFYLKLAYSKQHFLLKPFQLLAKLRCNFDFYKFPIEKKLANLFIKKEELS
jgi:radical SAM superfamily enzyme YgiQ (UPF0313 family)